jgi:hypothetical protein
MMVGRTLVDRIEKLQEHLQVAAEIVDSEA